MDKSINSKVSDLETRIVSLETKQNEINKYFDGDWLLSKSFIKRSLSIVIHQFMLGLFFGVAWFILIFALGLLSR